MDDCPVGQLLDGIGNGKRVVLKHYQENIFSYSSFWLQKGK